MKIKIPRYRDTSIELKLIEKKIAMILVKKNNVMNMYARGMSQRERQNY
jgi:transposase-like protein